METKQDWHFTHILLELVVLIWLRKCGLKLRPMLVLVMLLLLPFSQWEALMPFRLRVLEQSYLDLGEGQQSVRIMEELD